MVPIYFFQNNFRTVTPDQEIEDQYEVSGIYYPHNIVDSSGLSVSRRITSHFQISDGYFYGIDNSQSLSTLPDPSASVLFPYISGVRFFIANNSDPSLADMLYPCESGLSIEWDDSVYTIVYLLAIYTNQLTGLQNTIVFDSYTL